MSIYNLFKIFTKLYIFHSDRQRLQLRFLYHFVEWLKGFLTQLISFVHSLARLRYSNFKIINSTIIANINYIFKINITIFYNIILLYFVSICSKLTTFLILKLKIAEVNWRRKKQSANMPDWLSAKTGGLEVKPPYYNIYFWIGILGFTMEFHLA